MAPIVQPNSLRSLQAPHAPPNASHPHAFGGRSEGGEACVFLFTDIEGSTRRWETAPEAMADALARHDALVRAAIEAHGGRVFKTVGDAFCAAFDDAVAALVAAHAAQRALEDHDWSAIATGFAPLRARMAVHAGLAQARDDDYFGPSLNRVARLLAAGHGGQVLCSGAAHALAAAGLPAGLALRELGEHRLKDLDRAERIFQLDPASPPDGRPIAFPPLRTLDAVPGNLPIQLSSFVGREREMAALRATVAEHRLVTVTGIGGTGKTRLALQVAADLAEGFIDGVWFVDLAPRTDDESVAATAAAVLGVRDDPSRPIEDAVVDHLRDRRALLLLDNCEHLVGASARFAAAVGRSCPGVHVLATSREPLAIAGEQVFPLEPLEVPVLLVGTPDDEALARLGQLEVVRLFIDRATAIQPAFRVDATSAPHVAEICHRLDGIPLAIELAAARVRALAPAEIARRLDQRFQLLTGGHRDRLPRQQTLQAAIDWSYELLTDVERRVLERFSVFAGAAPMAAAEAVCSGDGVAERVVLDVMDGLVAKSLVAQSDVRGETWFRMLDTIRAYAGDKLGGDEASARERQLRWYVGVAEGSRVDQLGAEADAWSERLEPLAADFFGVLERAAAMPSLVAGAARAVEALWWFLRSMQPRQGWSLLGNLVRHLEEGGLGANHPLVYWQASMYAFELGFVDRCTAYAQAGLAAAEAMGEPRYANWCLQVMAFTRLEAGDLESAEGLIQRAIAIAREHDLTESLSVCTNILGELARERGDAATAAARYAESLAILPPAERSSGLALWPLHNLGQARLLLGDLAGAGAVLREALALRPAFDALFAASCLAGLGGVAAAAGRGRRAARLLGASDRLLGETDWRLRSVDETARLRYEAAARALLPPDEWDAAFAEGRGMSPDEAVAFALDRGAAHD